MSNRIKYLVISPTGTTTLAGSHGELQSLEQAESKAKELALPGAPALVYELRSIATKESVLHRETPPSHALSFTFVPVQERKRGKRG